MTLTAIGLANAITTSQTDAQNKTIQSDANLKLATAIVDYFKANTVVTVNTGTGVGTIS